MLQKKKTNSQDMRLQENHGLQNFSKGGGGGKLYLASGLFLDKTTLLNLTLTRRTCYISQETSIKSTEER